MNYRLFHLFFLLFLATPGLAQNQSELEAYLSEIAALKSFSGSVFIAKKGIVLLNKGFGMANAEHQIPNMPNSVH